MDEHTLKDHAAEQRLFQKRIGVVVVIILVLTTLLISRLAILQIGEYKLYTTLSLANQLSVMPLPPNRGLIYDRKGVLIAENIPVFSLEIIPSEVTNLTQTIAALAKTLPITIGDIESFNRERKQKRPFEASTLRVKLTPEEIARFSVDQYRFPGVHVKAHLIRNYPAGSSLVTALGYVGRINESELKKVDSINYKGTDYIGKIGLEKYDEAILHGRVGYQEVETDANGQILRVEKSIAPIPGANLYLTIDSGLQQAAETALGNDHGAVVIIEPKTGDILALVSNPSYDPNLFVTGISNKDYTALLHSPDQPLFNRTVRGEYPPGSTIKPIEALQMLALNIVNPNTKIFDPGWFTLPNSTHRYRDWWKGGHGWVNLNTAIEVSCDTYFFNFGYKMGINNIDAIFRAFGFGQETGIEMNEELGGLVPTPTWKKKAHHQSWYPGDTVITAIGQGFLLVTPLQLAQAEAVLAERGTLVAPHLVLKTQYPNGQIIKTMPVPKTAIQLPPQIWNTIIAGMANVTQSPRGTAYPVFGQTKSYTIAGKTGTAQVFSISQQGDNYHEAGTPKRLLPHSWFAGFAPVDHPQIAIAIIVEHSPHRATRAAKEILDYYFNVQPTLAPAIISAIKAATFTAINTALTVPTIKVATLSAIQTATAPIIKPITSTPPKPTPQASVNHAG